LNVEDAIKIYDSILKFTAKHGFVPTIQYKNGHLIDSPAYPGDDTSQLNEILSDAFGENIFSVDRAAIDISEDV
jgi:hypothetical protein